MAQNVKINGVTYSNVPSVAIPKDAGGGNATFLTHPRQTQRQTIL